MKNIALITGASSGIGKELAFIHALEGDLVLVARNEVELNKIKIEIESKFNRKVVVIAKDLTAENAIQEVYNELVNKSIRVDILINNAGYGGLGYFSERELAQEQNMIDLNVKALVGLTHLILPQMIESKSGKILNTASIAAFMPGPLQTVYFATKAFVVSFSQALAFELKNSGVTVTALCPGPVNTNFATAANMGDSELFKSAATAKLTAQKGYNAMLKGKLKVITDWKMRIMIFGFQPFMPIKAVMSVIFKLQSSILEQHRK